MTGIPLKPIRILMKPTILSYRHFVQFTIYFPMNKMKIKTKMKKQKKNIKITKSFLNLLRSGQRNCIFLN